MIVLLDVAAGPVSSSSGVSLVILLLLIIVIEAVVLRLNKWRGMLVCLLDSTLMNVASALPGLLLITGIGFVGLLIAFALSVVIEAGALLLLRRHSARRTWFVSLIANSASYALLLALLILFAR